MQSFSGRPGLVEAASSHTPSMGYFCQKKSSCSTAILRYRQMSILSTQLNVGDKQDDSLKDIHSDKIQQQAYCLMDTHVLYVLVNCEKARKGSYIQSIINTFFSIIGIILQNCFMFNWRKNNNNRLLWR